MAHGLPLKKKQVKLAWALELLLEPHHEEHRRVRIIKEILLGLEYALGRLETYDTHIHHRLQDKMRSRHWRRLLNLDGRYWDRYAADMYEEWIRLNARVVRE